MKKCFTIPVLLIALILVLQVTVLAQLTPARQQLLKFGPALYIRDVHTEPAEIVLGTSAVLKIKLENIGGFTIKDIKIKIDLPVQFAPIKDITEKKIREIYTGNMEEINFSIIALPDTKLGIYKVNLTITYLDEIGQSYTEPNKISLVVSAVPKIFMKIDSSEIYQGNRIGRVVISVINNGVADLKFLTAELQKSEDYEILTAEKVHIGELDSDDYETVEFRLKISKGKTEVNLPLKLDYSDANDKKYSELVEVPLYIRTAREAGVTENKSGWIISAIAVLVLVYMVYRSFFRKKFHKKH